jgi:hypothetical protein
MGRPNSGALHLTPLRSQWAVCATAFIGLCYWTPGQCAILQVGPDALLKTPSAAAALAQDGDTVVIAPGTYFDCAVWHANKLTIEGADAGAVLTDTPCEGKASFVILGNGVTVRNLTFTRIRVPDRNGAGIRAEGRDLTVEKTQFINDQIGILAADSESSSISIHDCDFTGNGLPDSRGTADLLIGRVSLLRVEGSRLKNGKGGAPITSNALRSTLIGNSIEAGQGVMSAYVVGNMDGGSLIMNDNTLTLSPGSATSVATVAVAQDDGFPSGDVTLQHSVLINQTGKPAILLRNWGSATPVLAGNILQPGDIEVSADGATFHNLKQFAHHTIAWLRGLAGSLRHLAAVGLRAAHLY